MVTHHPLVPGAAIGVLSLLLALGLEVMGVLQFINLSLSNLLSQGKDFPQSLPPWVIWLVAGGFAFGIPCSMIHLSPPWQRMVVWLTAVLVVMGWAPVLALAAYAPEISAVMVVSLWSGICALVHVRNEVSKPKSDEIF